MSNETETSTKEDTVMIEFTFEDLLKMIEVQAQAYDPGRILSNETERAQHRCAMRSVAQNILRVNEGVSFPGSIETLVEATRGMLPFFAFTEPRYYKLHALLVMANTPHCEVFRDRALTLAFEIASALSKELQ